MVNVMALMGHGNQWFTGGMNQVAFAMSIAVSMVVFTMFQQFLSDRLGVYLRRCIRKWVSSLDPFVQIKFHEDSVGGPKNGEAYAAIETYLSANCSVQAPRLKANAVRDIKTPVLCIDEGEDVSDEFNGVKVWWHLTKEKDSADGFRGSKIYRYYNLTFRRLDRETVLGEYLKHVMHEGKDSVATNRQLKLYSNSSSEQQAYWSYIMNFDHPATFDTVAMENEKKQDIIEDLETFSTAKEYYRRIGKPWKRGYLLYGPPGTGKSTMIAAIANRLRYDVYDLELTAVWSNDSLKRLLNRTPCNSILVIEDIDCLSNITGQRETKPSEDKKIEKVTLSGLLNCVDGLFSANEGGRLMIFTTNHVENLDSALIRKGRMDKHIEMLFCGFEAFRVLAKNYLGIEKHELFPKIQILLEEVQITPADVAENLITKSAGSETSADACLETLIGVLEKKLEEKNNLGSSKEGEKEEERESEKEREAAKENGIVIIKENGCAN